MSYQLARTNLVPNSWVRREKPDEFRTRRLLMKTLRVFYFFWSDFLNKDIGFDIDSYHIVYVIFAPSIDDTNPRDYEDSGVRELIVVYHEGKDHIIRHRLINPWTGPLEPEFESDDEDAILDEYKLGGGKLVYNSRMKYLDSSSNPRSICDGQLRLQQAVVAAWNTIYCVRMVLSSWTVDDTWQGVPGRSQI